MNELSHGSLFSGIGGFDLAAHWAGIPTLWQVEKDAYCRAVLRKHFPNAKQFEDIKDVGKEQLEPVSIISGGFPCTQTSLAAAMQSCRQGLHGKDSRLWFEYLRVVKERKPAWVIVENPPGVETWASTITGGLESIGYRVSRIKRTAWSVGAPHLRRRVLFIANSMYERCFEVSRLLETQEAIQIHSWPAPPRGTWSSTKSGILRMDAGIPNRVDRLKGLGNAIVPQIAFQLFQAIKEVEKEQC